MMPSRMFLTIPWLILLALTWRVVAQVPQDHGYLAARQELLPVFSFIGLSGAEFTSCAPASFNWMYTGPSDPVSISISDVDVRQATTTSLVRPLSTFADESSPAFRSLHRRDDVNITLILSINPRIGQLKLTSLPVPRGSYQLVVVTNSTSPHTIVNSSVFSVQEGTDTSCLSTTSLTASLTSLTFAFPSSLTSNLPSITGNDVPPTATPAVKIFERRGRGGNSSGNTAIIVGGVVLGVLVTAAVGLKLYGILKAHQKRKDRTNPSSTNASSTSEEGGQQVLVYKLNSFGSGRLDGNSTTTI